MELVVGEVICGIFASLNQGLNIVPLLPPPRRQLSICPYAWDMIVGGRGRDMEESV